MVGRIDPGRAVARPDLDKLPVHLVAGEAHAEQVAWDGDIRGVAAVAAQVIDREGGSCVSSLWGIGPASAAREHDTVCQACRSRPGRIPPVPGGSGRGSRCHAAYLAMNSSTQCCCGAIRVCVKRIAPARRTVHTLAAMRHFHAVMLAPETSRHAYRLPVQGMRHTWHRRVALIGPGAMDPERAVFVAQTVALPLLEGGRLLEEERYICLRTGIADRPHPAMRHGAPLGTTLTADNNPGDARQVQGLDGRQERLDAEEAHHRRDTAQQGQTTCEPGRVPTTDAKPDMGPSVPPIRRETAPDTARALGENHVRVLRGGADNVPGFRAPGVGLLDEEVTPGAGKDAPGLPASAGP